MLTEQQAQELISLLKKISYSLDMLPIYVGVILGVILFK